MKKSQTRYAMPANPFGQDQPATPGGLNKYGRSTARRSGRPGRKVTR